MITDPIADMLSRIRNALAVKKSEVVLPYSKIKYNLAKVLQAENYLEEVAKISNGRFAELKIVLKYSHHGPAIRHLKRLSRPSQRIYVAGKEMPKVLNGYGQAIVSTSQGIMTSKQARRKNVGGELICEIW